MCPQYAWATHQRFFHNLLRNITTIYLGICSMSSLRVYGEIGPNWEFIVDILWKTQWVCSWAYSEQIMKEPLMSGSGILWAHFEQIYERNPRVFSKSGSKVYWWVLFDKTLNLPTGYIEIKVVGFFWISSHFTHQICWEQSEK